VEKKQEKLQNMQIKIVKHHPQTEKYNKYQMKCLDCPLKYTGQTGRIFHIIYIEHIYKQLEIIIVIWDT
jgi:hypothetical protein